MKCIIIFLIILLHNQDANCDAAFQVLVDHFNNFAKFVATAMANFGCKVTELLQGKQGTMHKERPAVNLITPDVVNALISAKRKQMQEDPEQAYDFRRYMKSTEQLVKTHHKNLSIHTVTTDDGYVLTLHRIQPLYNLSNRSILLHHGLLGSSIDWILNGAKKSLPYLLTDAGFDVWLTNARGNNYSNKHTNYSTSSLEFWNFTWQEMGMYDLPAVIDYIRKTKDNEEKIDFIGYSMGASALLVLLSTRPVYNNYLNIGILIAPLVYMSNSTGPLRVLSSISMAPSDMILKVLGNGMFMPQQKIPEMLVKKYCVKTKILCSNPLFFITGGLKRPAIRSKQFAAKLLYHLPATTSTHTILHFAQLIKTGKFHAYNDETTVFSLKNVTLPIAIFSSTSDWLSTVPDALKLFVQILNPIQHIIYKSEDISHTEFMWGAASKLVFNKILETLQKSPKNNISNLNEV